MPTPMAKGITSRRDRWHSVPGLRIPDELASNLAEMCKRAPCLRVEAQEEREYFKEKRDSYLESAVGKDAGDVIDDGYNFTKFAQGWNKKPHQQ